MRKVHVLSCECGFEAASSQPDPLLCQTRLESCTPPPWSAGRQQSRLVGRLLDLQSSVFPRAARDGRTNRFNMDKPVRWDEGCLWQTCSLEGCHRGVDAHWDHRSSKAPLGLDFVLPYRRHDLGPISWCGGPAASVSRQPLVWSRDHNSGHVTSHRAAGPHQTAPQSSLLHLHTARLTTRNCGAEIFAIQKTSRGLHGPLPTPTWFKHYHLFHVGPDAAL